MKHPQSSLPPGFRFHPTDEELILHYLKKKLSSSPFPVSIIADVNIYKFDPWDLPAKSAFGEKEWYFFSPRDRKYPNGARPNRAAGSGYWKATGTDKVIVTSSVVAGGGGEIVQENIGVKKALVFYKGRPPKGIKTNWIMHEYRLAENPNSISNYNNRPVKYSKDCSMRLDDWVLCRIYKKSHGLSSTSTTSSSAAAATSDQDQEEEETEQFIQDALLVPSLINPGPGRNNSSTNYNNTLQPQKSCSFSNLLDAMDYSMLSSFLADNQTNTTGFESSSPFSFGSFEQPQINNFTNGSNTNSSRVPNVENKLKRQHSSNIMDEADNYLNSPPTKKFNSSWSYNDSSSTTSHQSDHMMMTHYNFLNQSFINHKSLLLSSSTPHLQFQG